MAEDELIQRLRMTVGATSHYGVAAPDIIVETERSLGFPLPPPLRRIYSEVQNGGFGPGYGLLGLRGGHLDADGQPLALSYAALRAHGWPDRMLPLFDLGDAAWASVDASANDCPIVIVGEDGVSPTKYNLAAWLEDWMEGKDMEREVFEFEPVEMVTPKGTVRFEHRGRPKSSGAHKGDPPGT